MRPGRAAVAAIVSGTVVAFLGWNASHEVESQERAGSISTAYAGKYNAVAMRGGDAAMRRTVQHMISW
jgi:hypothetical protein